MIKLLKNKEVRKALMLQILVAIAFVIISYLIDELSRIVALIFSTLFILIYYISTYKRYKRIASLAGDINKVLHGETALTLENYSEGELAILHSEIYKMTVRLREQQNKLMNDKVYLADSIADISHQIRTPLTSINLLVQLLSAPNLTDERRQELIHELYGMLSRIEWLITTLLKISKLDAGTVQFKKEKVSLQTLINKSCSTLLVPIELRGQQLVINTNGDFIGDLYQCACGDSYNADYKDACGHSVIIDKAVATTCTKAGKTEGSHCSACNTVIVAQKQISAKGHSWSKWTVTKAASVGAKGEEKRICNTCNISETRSIAAITQDEYEVFKEKIGVYYTDNVKYEYLKNHFDYSAYIQVYTLSKSSENEKCITSEFENHFGFKATAKVSVEKVGTYLVDGKLQTVYSYSIDDKTYPFVDHALYDVYHQICVDGVSHWVGFAIEGGNDDDWGELMSTPKVQTLKKEMYKTFYEKTGYSAEYISSHEEDFCIGYISQAGTMRTQDGRLIEVLYIYCRETGKK